MTEVHDTARVIRRVSRDTEPTRKSERKVTIDVKNGRAVDRVGLLDFWREFKYFIVSNSDDPSNEASGIINLTYGGNNGNNRMFNIDLNYRAWCSPGKEKQVAQALYHGDDPGEVFSGLLSKWAIENINTQNGSFTISSSEVKSFLQAAIRTKAQVETGLSVDVEFSIESYPVRPIRITDSFLVRAKDYDKEESLNIVVEVDDVENVSLTTIQYSNEALKQLLENGVQDYFAHYVSLHQFYYKLKDDEFKYFLVKHLNDILNPGGCKVTFLSLEKDQQPPIPIEPFKVQVNVAFDIDDGLYPRQGHLPSPDNSIFEMDDGPSPVIIKNTILMRLQNVARYFANGSPNLTGWVENELKKLINNELIGAQVIDLVPENYTFTVERIKQDLSLSALAIGYEITFFKSTPDLQANKWLVGIEIKIDPSGAEFETSLSRFFVKLGLSLTVRVKDFSLIKVFLERQQYVPDLMRKALLSTTRQFLRKTHPDEFYRHFFQAGTPDEWTFEDGLKARLSTMLEKRFNAEIDDEVVFEAGETEIINVLGRLQSARCEFKILVPPSRKTQEECVFRGNFKVIGVDRNGWEDFGKTLPDIAQVREHLEAGIRTALENHPTALITFRDTLNISLIEDIVSTAAQSAVLNDYGLQVVITNIGSDATESEKEIAKNVTRTHTLSVGTELKQYFSNVDLITKQIRDLEEQIIRIEAGVGQEKVIEEIRKRIETLKQHSTIEPIASGLCYTFQNRVDEI